MERNEIVAAVSDAIIVIEADEGSGTRHTVEFAENLSVPVFVVPDNITSPTSAGANNMHKTNHAQIITYTKDAYQIIGLARSGNKRQLQGSNPHEQSMLNLLGQQVSNGYQLLTQRILIAAAFAGTVTMLEISAKINALGANNWALA